ncbi:MAG: hypothetical protein ABIZ05_01860 [Pseudonocardiaceae bacterium]
MPPRQQAVEPSPTPSFQVFARIRRSDWDTTPGWLRVAQLLLVLGILLAGGVAAYDTNARVNTTGDIAGSLEPLNGTVSTLYRSLADADATVAKEYLSAGMQPNETLIPYGDDVHTAATSLALAGTQAGAEPATAKLIADITSQLPEYTGLVERARANNRQNFAVGASYLRSASALMQNTILPETAKLQQRQAARLGDAYQQAGSVPFVALAFCLLSLAGLFWAQVFVFRRTHRVFNVGLVLASVAVLTGLLWWTVAGVASARSLTRALGHSRSVSDALAPAQIDALNARALESLELVDRDAPSLEAYFDNRMRLLAGNNGALDTAERFATDQKGKALVQTAVEAARGYATAHAGVEQLDGDGKYLEAVDAAVHTTAAMAFNRLGAALQAAVDYEHGAFTTDIERAQGRLDDLPIGTVVLTLVAMTAVAWGFQRRLEEYR